MALVLATTVLGVVRGPTGGGLSHFTADLVWFFSLASLIPIGALIASRHPNNPVGWLMAAIGLSEVVSRFSYEYAAYSLVTHPGSLPGGAGAAWLDIARLATFEEILFAVIPVVMVCLAASLVCLVLRFRRSRGEERQQLKWVALAAVLGALNIVLSDLLLGPAGLESRATELVSETIGGPGVFAGAAGVAILKYRLYDIDRIISRTLVYGLLTAFLGAAYFGVVVVLQTVLGGGVEDSPLAVAGTTLAVAALFRPARQRIQIVIDRRFNRHRYDTQKTVDAFSTRLRDDVDIDTLATDLLAVVRQTMEPAHASLWLRGSAGTRAGASL